MKRLLLSFAVLALSGWSLPCWAQHMNAAGAPCRDAGVNVEVGNCFAKAYKDADGELNHVYAKAQAALDPEAQQNLTKAQRAWLLYRDAACDAERALYDGGTGAFAAGMACLEAETRARIRDLHETYGWRIEKISR